MPALQRQDVPCSAIDFHTSNVLDWLLEHSAVGPAARHVAERCDCAPEAALKKAMWRHSSRLNSKRCIEPQVLPTPWQHRGGTAQLASILACAASSGGLCAAAVRSQVFAACRQSLRSPQMRHPLPSRTCGTLRSRLLWSLPQTTSEGTCTDQLSSSGGCTSEGFVSARIQAHSFCKCLKCLSVLSRPCLSVNRGS